MACRDGSSDGEASLTLPVLQRPHELFDGPWPCGVDDRVFPVGEIVVIEPPSRLRTVEVQDLDPSGSLITLPPCRVVVEDDFDGPAVGEHGIDASAHGIVALVDVGDVGVLPEEAVDVVSGQWWHWRVPFPSGSVFTFRPSGCFRFGRKADGPGADQ